MHRKQKLLLVTLLTFSRVPLVFLFFAGALVHVLLPGDAPWLFKASFACLALSALTDLVDGWLARRLEVTTAFGAHADPMTDKIFYLTTLPLLVFIATMNGHIAHAVVLLCFTVLFLFRDQWVSFLRSLGAAHGVDGRANWSGKLRTAYTFPLVCVIYWFESVPAPAIGIGAIYALEAIGFVINVVSGLVYTQRYWPLVRRSIASGDALNRKSKANEETEED